MSEAEARTHELEKLCVSMVSQYKAKNEAYGNSFSKTVERYGLISALTRMSDKWNRIEALILGAENNVKDESLRDTLVDMACYALMTVMEIDQK